MSTNRLGFLVIEDDDDHAELAARALRDSGVASMLHRARDGEEALRMLRSGETAARPDAILLDLKLPRKTGHEVLRDLKGDPHLARIPVIVLTTSHADADRGLAEALGANQYLIKPLDSTAVADMVRDVTLTTRQGS